VGGAHRHTLPTYSLRAPPPAVHTTSFKLAAKEKLMDDLRAGLVAAGRAVSEAQQEAEAVKKAVGQQEKALAGKYGTSVDVLKRLGDVTAKLEGRDSQIEALKAELSAAKKTAEDSGVQLAVVQKAARVKEAEAATAMAAAKKASISREVELNAALAAAKSAAQKAMASAASARAERTADIIDVLSAKETQVEGLMTALDAIKVERDMMASEGVPEEDKEEVAEKDVLIRALLADLAKENGWRPAAEEVVTNASQQELRDLRDKLEKAEKAAGIVPMSARLAAAGMAGGANVAVGYKASVADVGAYNQSEIDALRSALDERERALGATVVAVSRSPNPIAAFSRQEVETLRAALTSREKELGLEPTHGAISVSSLSTVGGLPAKELEALRSEIASGGAKRTLATLEAELLAARATAKERAKLISELQREVDEMLSAGGDEKKREDASRSISARREEQLTAEVASLRDQLDSAKTTHSSSLQSRDALIDGLKTDFNTTRKRLGEAENQLAGLKREAAAREVEAQAESASHKAAAEAARVAHAAQVAAKEAAIDALRADLAAARRAISSAEADIVSLKKQAASREAQLQAELAAAKRSYEVLKLAAAAGGVTGAADAGPDTKPGANDPSALLRPSELTAQLAAREAQVESLRAELLAVRRAVAAAEEEAQSRRESAAALESELSAELGSAKAAHEAAELAAAELATNAANNAQNAAKMMSLLSEQLAQEREARRVLEAELRSAMEAHPDLPRMEFPLPPLAQPKGGGSGLGGLVRGIVAGVAAGLVTRVAMPPNAQAPGERAGGGASSKHKSSSSIAAPPGSPKGSARS
jgi:chromosome segregation ATPase